MIFRTMPGKRNSGSALIFLQKVMAPYFEPLQISTAL